MDVFFKVKMEKRKTLEKALSDILSKRMSVYRASKIYGIPETTLKRKKKQNISLDKKPGITTVLSKDEEDKIGIWIIEMASRGFPITSSKLRQSVQLYLNLRKRETMFKENLPGRKWCTGFMKRHPNLTSKVPQHLSHSRSQVTEENLRMWHREIHQYVTKNDNTDIFQNPSRIFNMDETAFYLAPKGEKVITTKKDKACYAVSANDDKECITVLIGGNAAGTLAPPLIIYSYQRIPFNIAKNTPLGWGLGTSENGWMTSKTFYEYITNVFHPWVLKEKIELPIILFVDGHR